MYDMTDVHKANLAVLKEIDRICRKYRLKYLLDAGTLIGAVRHQGFIPWDDDADVAMTRANFDAFFKGCAQRTSGRDGVGYAGAVSRRTGLL